MTRADQAIWRQKGFMFGRYGHGLSVDGVRKIGGDEAVRFYLEGKRAGVRERELAKGEPVEA